MQMKDKLRAEKHGLRNSEQQQRRELAWSAGWRLGARGRRLPRRRDADLGLGEGEEGILAALPCSALLCSRRPRPRSVAGLPATLARLRWAPLGSNMTRPAGSGGVAAGPGSLLRLVNDRRTDGARLLLLLPDGSTPARRAVR